MRSQTNPLSNVQTRHPASQQRIKGHGSTDCLSFEPFALAEIPSKLRTPFLAASLFSILLQFFSHDLLPEAPHVLTAGDIPKHQG